MLFLKKHIGDEMSEDKKTTFRRRCEQMVVIMKNERRRIYIDARLDI